MSVRFVIPDRKLASYLLNLSHPRGGSKARFFCLFGFSPERPAELATARLEHAQVATRREEPGRFDESKLICDGPLSAPNGRTPQVRSVWHREPDDTVRLVTVVPLRQSPS